MNHREGGGGGKEREGGRKGQREMEKEGEDWRCTILVCLVHGEIITL